jgi:hypothetical protein
VGTSDNEKDAVILEAITAFKSKDFEKSYAIATGRHVSSCSTGSPISPAPGEP